MAWESRPNGGRYYTRSRREGGRVIREYVGCGSKGVLAAAADADHRAEREAERAMIRAEQEQVRALDAEIVSLHRTFDVVTRGALLAAGFERHKRQWRKRRDDTIEDAASEH